MTFLPDSDLAEIAAEAWRRLAEGAARPEAPFRRMQLATLGAHGWPEVRTVILRTVEGTARRVAFFTDARSTKATEIAADGRVCLHVWDREAELQLRLWGQAARVTERPTVEDHWEQLTEFQRRAYRGPAAPGTTLDDPTRADPGPASPEEASDAGRENFAVVGVAVARFEWLQLRREGHRRARFDWQGHWRGRWLVP